MYYTISPSKAKDLNKDNQIIFFINTSPVVTPPPLPGFSSALLLNICLYVYFFFLLILALFCFCLFSPLSYSFSFCLFLLPLLTFYTLYYFPSHFVFFSILTGFCFHATIYCSTLLAYRLKIWCMSANKKACRLRHAAPLLRRVSDKLPLQKRAHPRGAFLLYRTQFPIK